MADIDNTTEEEVIVPDVDINEEDIQPSYSEEDLKIFSKLWIDPDNATTEDLIRVAKRAAKAEEKIVSVKKEIPKKIETSIDTELRFFFLENPELKDNREWIIEILKQPKYKDLTPKEANILYEALKPKESETRRLDTPNWQYKPKPKWLDELSEEEALKLQPHEYLKRLKLKWELR